MTVSVRGQIDIPSFKTGKRRPVTLPVLESSKAQSASQRILVPEALLSTVS